MNHVIKLELDPQRGGWIARCSCEWEAKRAHWYKNAAKRDGDDHMEVIALQPEPAESLKGQAPPGFS